MQTSQCGVLDLGVSQYERWENKDLPYHWAIMLRFSKDSAWFYQIRGTPDTFELAPFDLKKGFSKSGTYRGSLKIGQIQAVEREAFEEVIQSVPIHLRRTDWNCQNWVVSALERLQAAGFLSKGVTFNQQGLLNDLKEVNEKWNKCEGTF